MRSVPIPVPETTWNLVVNGERIASGTASRVPDALFAWALTEIRHRDTLHFVACDGAAVRVDATGSPPDAAGVTLVAKAGTSDMHTFVPPNGDGPP